MTLEGHNSFTAVCLDYLQMCVFFFFRHGVAVMDECM